MANRGRPPSRFDPSRGRGNYKHSPHRFKGPRCRRHGSSHDGRNARRRRAAAPSDAGVHDGRDAGHAGAAARGLRRGGLERVGGGVLRVLVRGRSSAAAARGETAPSRALRLRRRILGEGRVLAAARRARAARQARVAQSRRADVRRGARPAVPPAHHKSRRTPARVRRRRLALGVPRRAGAPGAARRGARAGVAPRRRGLLPALGVATLAKRREDDEGLAAPALPLRRRQGLEGLARLAPKHAETGGARRSRRVPPRWTRRATASRRRRSWTGRGRRRGSTPRPSPASSSGRS